MNRISVASNFLRLQDEQGISLVEVLLALVFSAIVGLGLMSSSKMAFDTSHNSISRSYAMKLAMDRLEQLSALDPASLTAASNQTETLTQEQLRFTRITTISINADRTRQIQVRVTHTCPIHAIDLTVSDAFSLRGER